MSILNIPPRSKAIDIQTIRNNLDIKEKKHQCLNCEKKVGISKVFCGKNCKEKYFNYIKVIMPVRFVMRLHARLEKEERDKELESFAKNHKFCKEAVFKKYTEMVKELD